MLHYGTHARAIAVTEGDTTITLRVRGKDVWMCHVQQNAIAAFPDSE
jgi:hypothetical protein